MSEKPKDSLRSLHLIVFVSYAADLGFSSSCRLGSRYLLLDSSTDALTFMVISMKCQSQEKMKGIALIVDVTPSSYF